MKITPLIKQNNFKGALDNSQPFKMITSKTAENLYNTDFVGSCRDLGKDCFSTFVLAEKTGKPVEVFIKPLHIGFKNECAEFTMYKKMKNGKLLQIGTCYYDLDAASKQIGLEFMQVFKKGFKGIGFRINQIIFERMLMLDYNNIKLISTIKAYPFYNCLGYTGSEKNGILNLSQVAQKDWMKIVQKQPILIGKKLSLKL